jgi:hypothetical protein
MSKARTAKPTTVPGIPKPPGELSPTLRKYLENLSEAVEIRLGRRGDPRDRAITLRELIDSGLAVELGANPYQVGPAPPPPPPPPPLSATPTAPTNFTATGGYSLVTCFWDFPNYGPHSHTEIWRHDQNIIGDAQLVGISSGISFVDPVGEGASFYYWARHVSLYDIQGPFNSADGTLAETALNVVELLNILTGAITETQLYQALQTRINLIDAGAEVAGSVAARILAESTARTQAIAAEAQARTQAISAEAEARADAIAAEALARGTAITNEATIREGADENLAQQITTLTSVTLPGTYATIAALQQEASARTDGDSAEAFSRETLAAQIRGAYNGNDISALTSGLIFSEREARVGADSALATRTDALEATVNNPNTGVVATSTAVSTLVTEVFPNGSASASRIDNLEVTVGQQGDTISGNSSALSILNAEVFPNGSASASRIDTLESTVNNPVTGVTATATAVSTLNTEIFPNGTSQASRVDTLESTVNNPVNGVVATSNVVSLLATEVFPNGTASASRLDTLESAVNHPTTGLSANATATSLVTTEVFPNGTASASRIDGLESTVNNPTNGLAATASAVSVIQTEVFPNGTGAASAIDQLAVSIGDNTAAIQQEAQARINSDNSLLAQYTVKIDLNGYVSGFGLASTAPVNGTPSSEFIVRVDRFSVASPGQTTIVPFIVQASATTINGVSVPAGVYMNDAYIRNGTITNAKIGNAAIDDAKIASLSADKITAGSLDAARIAIDNVVLDTYFDGSIGRRRLYIPDARINTAQIANAAITTAKIGDLAVSTLKIAGNAITQPQTYTAADKYVSSAITVSGGGYTYVGYPNGDYIYEPEFGGYYYVGAGNGDYVYSSGGTVSGGHVAIETPQINVGVDSTAAVQIVFYGFCDGSLVNDGGQLIYMFVDKYANGSWSGYQVVGTSRVGARTGGGNTQSVFSIAMAHTAADLQSIKVKILVGSQATHLALGTPSNPTYLRNITISMLGAKR